MSHLFVFSGPSGIGKSHIIEYVLREAPANFHLIRRITNRKPRKDEDDSEYRFLNLQDFDAGVKAGTILQSGNLRGHSYGIDLGAFRNGDNDNTHGVTSLMQSAIAILRRFDDIRRRLVVIELVPQSEDVVRRTLARRGLSDRDLERELDVVRAFTRPVDPDLRFTRACTDDELPTILHALETYDVSRKAS